MNLETTTVSVPIHTDADGVIRVGGTRVTLDTVVTTFRQGATPEEVISKFPTLRLADVYTVISYYLQNQEEIDRYLHEREEEAERIREEFEVRFDLIGLRERLLARKATQG